jgi:hypothetical protein
MYNRVFIRLGFLSDGCIAAYLTFHYTAFVQVSWTTYRNISGIQLFSGASIWIIGAGQNVPTAEIPYSLVYNL